MRAAVAFVDAAGLRLPLRADGRPLELAYAATLDRGHVGTHASDAVGGAAARDRCPATARTYEVVVADRATYRDSGDGSASTAHLVYDVGCGRSCDAWRTARGRRTAHRFTEATRARGPARQCRRAAGRAVDRLVLRPFIGIQG